MYQAYWGLTQSPFRGHLDPRAFYQGPFQEEALARLHFLVDEHRTLGFLLGDSGTGKSMLLEVFAKQIGVIQREHALINLMGTDRSEFLWLLTGQLGASNVASATSPFALYRNLSDHILANRFQKIETILLLDDADEADEEVLEEILRLSTLSQTHDALLTIVLTARPDRLRRLGSRLLELAELRVDIDPWERDDTAAFIKQALAAAGRSTPIFGEAAMDRIHELSGGVPRRVKQLADFALLAGAGANQAQIEAELIDTVFQEVGVDCTAASRDISVIR